MKLYSEEEAKKKKCCKFSSMCEPSNCMGWIEVESYVEREDHSGTSMNMNQLALARGVGAKVERKGPPGMGRLFMVARGHCCWVKHYVGEEK